MIFIFLYTEKTSKYLYSNENQKEIKEKKKKNKQHFYGSLSHVIETLFSYGELQSLPGIKVTCFRVEEHTKNNNGSS